LVVRDVPEPRPGEYDALCQLEFGATCSGTDLHLIHGRFPWPVAYPTVIGHESVGRVVEVGRRVRNLSVGDLVARVGTPASEDVEAHWGGFAEYGIARDHRAAMEDGRPAHEWHGYRINEVIPPAIAPEAAPMIITWRETLSYITRMGIAAGRSVLVLGSGGNGLAFAAHASHIGAVEVAVVGAGPREGQARLAGATQYLDYRKPGLHEALSALRSQGFDFIIDAVGKAAALDSVLPHLADQGTVGIYGIDDHGRCSLNPTRARGSFRVYQGGYDEAETHDAVVVRILDGRLDARTWLDTTGPFDLSDIGDAFEAVSRRRCVKALVRLGS
jgi:2-desacetyl-2-hydroxyethyl bacteriochlorophyllide A dehydrogenase